MPILAHFRVAEESPWRRILQDTCTRSKHAYHSPVVAAHCRQCLPSGLTDFVSWSLL